jgi:hypothetical protein
MMIEDRFDGVDGVAVDPAVDVGSIDVDDARRHPGLPATAFGAYLVLEGMLATEHHEGRPVRVGCGFMPACMRALPTPLANE